MIETLAEATSGWDVAMVAVKGLVAAFVLLAPALALWIRALARERNALADTLRDHGSPEAVAKAKAHPAVGHAVTKRLES